MYLVLGVQDGIKILLVNCPPCYQTICLPELVEAVLDVILRTSKGDLGNVNIYAFP